MKSKRWCVCALGAAVVAASVGCSGDNLPAAEDDTGSASIAITQAPADVTCLRLTVTGTRTLVRLLDIMPGQNTVFTVTGLPLGMDSFNAEAFNIPCGAINAMAIPTWLSDPVQANVVSGVPAEITLSLHRNGVGHINVDFNGDGTGGAGGAGGAGGTGGTHVGPVMHVASGGHHTCAIINQTVKCWGDNTFGQLGDGTFNGPPTARTVALGGPNTVPVDVTAGDDFSCALLSDGTVWCWGRNNFVQLAAGGGASNPVPTQMPTGTMISLVSGGIHSCGVRIVRDIVCWGGNSSGQLGNGGFGDAGVVQVAGIGDAVSVTAGRTHTCATRANSTVLSCWGDNTFGQLGIGDPRIVTNTPVNVVTTGVVEQVSAGSRHTCAIITDQGVSSIFCWGSNQDGQFGDGSTNGSLSPKPGPAMLAPGGRPVFISAGGDYTCALTPGSGGLKAFCWGVGIFGQLGNGMFSSSITPVPVSNSTSELTISAGSSHACTGNVFFGVRCWGQNAFGELGNGAITDAAEPVQVAF